ncbi:MAG: DUF1329 domain-containing protein [Candidatus Binatia bacterium]
MSRGSTILAATLLAAILPSSRVVADDSAMKAKEQAEIMGGVASGRPLADRPGKTLKGAEVPDKAKFRGLRDDDEVKIIRDEHLGDEFAVNLTLAKKWSELRGGSALEWTGKVAPAIKPGTVITPENYKSFPDLDKLLPPTAYARLAPGAWDPIKEIRVGETDPVFPTHEYTDATKNHRYEASGYTVKDWKGGMPFLKPADGQQALMNYLYRYWIDDLTFRFKWYLVGPLNNLERTITGRMFGMRFSGRTLVEPKPAFGAGQEGVLEKIGTLIESPKDVRGLALSRTRQVDMSVPDTIQYYLPAMRRVRRLSGRDTQDPIAGTDLCWDDYVGFYQQVSPENADVKLVGETEILHPAAWTKPSADGTYRRNVQPYDMKDMTVSFQKWQRRPVWVVDVISKDPSYLYSRRRLWIDREIPNVLYFEADDRKGNHWKSMQLSFVFNPTNGDGSTGEWVTFNDDINKHRTSWIFEWTSLPGLTPDDFDTSLLTKKTQ